MPSKPAPWAQRCELNPWTGELIDGPLPEVWGPTWLEPILARPVRLASRNTATEYVIRTTDGQECTTWRADLVWPCRAYREQNEAVELTVEPRAFGYDLRWVINVPAPGEEVVF